MTAAPAPRRGVRLTARLLAFNLLLVFLPVAGFLFFGPYEKQLLESQERSMVQQGRILAAALSGGEPPTAPEARRLIAALGRSSESRLRVVAADGTLLADSSRSGPRRDRKAERSALAAARARARESPIYALGALPFALWNRFTAPPPIGAADAAEYYSIAGRLEGPEIGAALAGRYGAATRLAPGEERAVILYSALPVRSGDQVVGAVLVSQSTARILGQIYEVRLRTFVVFLASLAAAIVLSLFLAGTITRPLKALAGEAHALSDGRGRLRGRFRGSRRGDEIGELARSLEELTRRLEARQAATEAFAADVSHELKNPLASIRSAGEMLAGAELATDRKRFSGVVEQEVARMERLLAGVREIVHLDAPETAEERRQVDLGALVDEIVGSFRLRLGDGARLTVRRPDEALEVVGEPERFAALVENLIDNALGFAPVGSEVELELARFAGSVRLTVADRGPGIPEEHLARVFDRFFTWRPAERGSKHSGLGLAIVRAVAEAHGGRAEVAAREGGGALFTVTLPAA